jgi:hypothetical protein
VLIDVDSHQHLFQVSAVYRGRVATPSVEAKPVGDEHRLQRAQEVAAKLRERSLNERFQCALSLLHGALDTHTAIPRQVEQAYSRVIHIAKVRVLCMLAFVV